MNNALEVKNLGKTYDEFSLNSVSFTLPTGCIMGFVGQNGAGKTTTIRLILNMAKRESGAITILGLDNLADELAIKQDLGAVFDEIFFLGAWRVREVEKAIRGFYKNWNSDTFNSYLAKFALSPSKRVRELSRGMKMKLMLTVAMSHDAKLLILDEPTSGLDPVARSELLDILRQYIGDGNKSVLFSTHITTDLERVADYITLIDQGRIIYTGAKDELMEFYYIIKGEQDFLTDAIKSKTIGITLTSSGFSGMIKSSEARDLPDEIVKVRPVIDEMLVYISKGGAPLE